METGYATTGPFKTLLRVSKVAHYETVFPSAFLCSRSAQVARRRRSVVDGAQPDRNGTERSSWRRVSRSRPPPPLPKRKWRKIASVCEMFSTYKCPTSWAATIIPENPPVSSIMATLLTFSSRLFTTQAPPTYANPNAENYVQLATIELQHLQTKQYYYTVR